MYYRSAHAAVVVYDITSAVRRTGPDRCDPLPARIDESDPVPPPPAQPSLLKARSWIAELQRQADPGITVMLVGNKLDLAEEQRQVSTEEAEKFAADEGLMFMEVSAKTAEGVKDVFDQIGTSMDVAVARRALPRSGLGY